MTDPLIHDFYLGFIRAHILYHALSEPVYGSELMRELDHHGYHVGPGTLYPILHGLENKGLLASSEQCVNGRIRKYYRITNLGRKAFTKIKEKANELINEINEEHAK
jgi:DNA-binding PadR family transcriptional regulator